MIFRKNTNQEQKNLDTMNSLYEFKNIINKMNDILESEEFEKLKEKILLLKNDNNCRTLDDALCFVDDTESYIFNILENIDCAIIRMTTKD